MNAPAKLVAKDIMTAPVVCIGAGEILATAQQLLMDAHITGLPVVEDGRLVGIITRSDYVRLPVLLKVFDDYVADRQYENGMQQDDRAELHAFRERLQTLTVHDVMTTAVVTCSADTPISEIAAKMHHHHVHRVVVVERDKPIGIVGSLDLVRLLEQ